MGSPFTSQQKLKASKSSLRNTWDWSHNNNLTLPIGRIVPCFCRRVPAGTSLRIKADFALQFMPMMFPIQTPIKARLSFYKMPIRALWKDYKNWISLVNMKDSEGQPLLSKYVPPHIAISSIKDAPEYLNFDKYFGTGSDLDYIGIPTTYEDVKDTLSAANPVCYKEPVTDLPNTIAGTCSANASFRVTAGSYALFTIGTYSNTMQPLVVGPSSRLIFSLPDSLTGRGEHPVANLRAFVSMAMYVEDGASALVSPFVECTSIYNSSTHLTTFSADLSGFVGTFPNTRFIVAFGSSSEMMTVSTSALKTLTYLIRVDDKSYSPERCPWYNSSTQSGLRVSSLPLRMREAVYNCYMRNIKNNPLVVNGVPTYNDYVINYDKGGNDTANYYGINIDGETTSLDYFYGPRYANWDPDYLTTCVPSPQQGDAPLVGLTSYVKTVQLDDGSTKTSLVNSITDEDGNTYRVDFVSDKEGLKGVNYTELTAEDSLGKPVTNLYAATSEGISIEDFRQVNAYQRYLELNLRRNYSYKEIIEGRYDVNVRYDDLLAPEFLGGFTRFLNVTPVTQTVPTNESGIYQGSLGSQAGLGFVRGESDAKIRCHCDEESIVMGFIHLSPTPVYTQTLLRDFLINDPLDIFTPEFSQIGYQPVPLAEVSPIQAFVNDPNSLQNTFGYQRPWYELLQMTDVAHGLFRTQLKNFLMKRTWSGVPSLSRDFLLVKPDQVNQVFSVTEVTDKVFGVLMFDIRVKNGVPRNNVPTLES